MRRAVTTCHDGLTDEKSITNQPVLVPSENVNCHLRAVIPQSVHKCLEGDAPLEIFWDELLDACNHHGHLTVENKNFYYPVPVAEVSEFLEKLKDKR